jgi:drug/metabolite transporter (DMT)-like permease
MLPKTRCPLYSQGILEVHAAILLLGLAGLFGKFLDLSPVLIVFGRAIFACATLGLVMLMSRRPTDSREKLPWRWVAVSGVLLAIHWVAFFHAIQLSTVAVGLLTFSSFPLFVTLLEPWFFHERRRWLDLFTAVLVMAGVAMIVPSFNFSNNITQGAVWGIVSGFVYAVLCILNRRLVTTHSALALTGGQNFVASLVLLPLVLREGASPSLRELLLLAILGVVCTALAHYLFIKSLAYVRAQLASVVTALESVYAILFAMLLLGEVPSVRTLAGGVVILGAVVVATLGRQNGKSVVKDRVQ